ncbi:hypothetical protein Tco_0421367, partial [Tanacetum coccineum]
LGVVPTIEKPINMYCDNIGAIAIANESGITKGDRHFRAKVHYLREVIEFGDIKLEKVYTYDNLADPFTKALAFPKHSELTRNIGMLLASSLMLSATPTPKWELLDCVSWTSSNTTRDSNNFDVDLPVRKLVMNRLGQLLRNFRRKLRQTYILPNQDTPSKLNEVPAKYTAILKSEDWVNFVNYTTTKEYKVSPVEIHPINSSADKEGGTTVVGCDQNDASIRKEMQKRETVKSVGAKYTTRSIRKEYLQCHRFLSKKMLFVDTTTNILRHLKKTTIIAEGTVYKSDGKIMLHNKALPSNCYKVSIDKSLVDAAFIPDVGSNGCTTVLDAVGGFVAWPKNQVVLDPKATPPSTIQMITGENKTAPKVQTKRKNIYVSSDAMQKEANKKRSQKALVY